MERMSGNEESYSIDFDESLQLNYCILDSGAPQVSDFIPGPLEDTDKYIEVADGHYVTSKQKGKCQINMCDNNGNTFIATFHNVLLAPDICNRLFSIITLMNSGRNFLFHKGFCTVYFRDKRKNAVTLPHSAQRKHDFGGETKKMSKSKKIAPRKKVALGLLHHRLGHISTVSLMDGYTENVWQDIVLRIYPDLFAHHVRYIQLIKRLGPKNH